jgi:hypothetical protein
MEERDTVAAARRTRKLLRDAACALEDAIGAPIGAGRPWAERVAGVLEDLAAAVAAHRSNVDAAGGLFFVVQQKAPRLVGTIELLRKEHDSVLAEAGELHAFLGAPEEAGVNLAVARERTAELLGRVLRMQHRCADLVYDAFAIDIGYPA